MHANAKSKLSGQITATLKRCLVSENWPQFESFEEQVDAIGNEVLKHRREWLDISDVYSIFYDLVAEALEGRAEKSKLSGNLWELLGDEESQALGQRLLEYFVSIPREYEIFAPFPAQSIDLNPINLGSNLSVVVFENSKDVPGGHSTGLLGMFDTKLKPKKAYFRYVASGYAGRSIQNHTVRVALRVFKIALQQGMAKGLFAMTNPDRESGLGFFSNQYTVPKVKLVSIDKARAPEKARAAELAIDVSKLIASLDLDLSGKVAEALIRKPIEEVIKGYLRLPVLLINNPAPEAERIRSAIEWCFDSYATEGEAMAFLQVCFGLEALLGEDCASEALTSTLADRCAYLVGTDIKGRNSIRERFKELYRTRSKLVHGTTAWLSSDQRHFLRWGRSVLEYAIFKEIGHLGMDG